MNELAPLLMMLINVTFGFVLGYIQGAKFDKTKELETEVKYWKGERDSLLASLGLDDPLRAFGGE